ncbi:hypothetical protein K505DRAFT_392551 [Melanomma pulvis-pyrius CBS 109.77]|uniref:DUF7580 domain-containing protein n=1 Tax=Melanomma pulvis-pyrius CBS 109.77 TaxID=1314802 RepID=A0A6A6XX73_9PLEO|nr:hypothetical protein K505DRAFT_392551 [Melanomma pulvis-pyrius CBS 109.77]
MSGVEIAAIVLKSFPILLQAANAFVPIFQGTKDWFTFEQTYKTFISDIRSESIFYKQSLQIFLKPFEFDLEENGLMHQNADAPLWHDPTTRNIIRLRIGDDFDWFLDQLRIIDTTLNALSDLLPKRDEKLQPLDAGTVAYEMNRLRVSFSTDKQPLMDMLKSTNSKINNFVQNETLIDHAPTSKDINIYKGLQKHAKTLYTGLLSHLTCTEPSHDHQCAIMADWANHPNNLRPPHLKLLLGNSSSWKQLRCSVRAAKAPTPSSVTSGPTISADIAMFDIQLRVQKWRGTIVEAAKCHKIGIAAISATSTLLNPKSERTELLWQERETTKLQKAENSNPTKAKFSKRLSMAKFGATIKRAGPQTNGSTTSAQTIASETVAKTHPDMEGGVKLQPTGKQAKKKVRFGEERSPSPTAVAEHIDSSPIVNVCDFLQNRTPHTEREYLDLEDNRLLFEIDPLDQTQLKSASTSNLENVFETLPRLPDRLRIGIRLIRTILSFGSSGWTPQDWDRTQLSILQYQQIFVPYISYPILRQHRNPLSKDQTMSLFFTLGIILIELTDKKTLEQTKEWKTYSAAGLQNDYLLRCVAGERHNRVKLRHDENLSEPIRRCINYGFTKVASLEDTEFLEEVVNGILTPLETFVERWETAPN